MADESPTMTFWEHLDELRARIVRAALAFVLGFGISWAFKKHLLRILTQPFVAGWNHSVGSKPTLHYPAPASAFLAYVKLSMLGGLLLALPIILYQVWAFVAPGLYAKEKRLALPFVASSFLLFVTGGYLGLRFAFPTAFEFLLGMSTLDPTSPIRVEPTVMIEEYMDFVIQALLACGLVFEIPVVVYFLSAIGLVNHTHLIRFARYFVVIAFVLAAIFTPPDPLSQLFVAGPMCILYGLSIGISWLVYKSKRKAQA